MPTKHQKKWPLFLIALPSVFFLAISVFYIFGFHVSPLSRDQWHMYYSYFNDGLINAALYPQSNHRHIIPYFIFHMDMDWFGGNNNFLTAFGFLFDVLVIGFLSYTLWLDKAFSRFTKFILTLFISLELLWLLNIAQLGWGFMSTMYYFAIFFYLFAIYMVWKALGNNNESNGTKYFVIAACCGVLCTFSFGIGILVWPTMLVVAIYMRAPWRFYFFVGGLLVFCLLVFFLLPGGDSVSDALSLNVMATITFPFKLAGGPVYFVFKSFRFFELGFLKEAAITVGTIAMIFGILLLVEPLFRKRQFSAFDLLCYALMMLGIATPMLITFSRIEMFLDPWVDRYQIWATMFWLGFIPVCLSRLQDALVGNVLRGLIVLMPFLLLPSQLDLGSRLAEYKVRVDNALLSYQMYIPVKKDAVDALHWNWEYKLPYMFDVLEHLRKQNKNIFTDRLDEWMGQTILLDDVLPQCEIQFIDKVSIRKNELINVANYIDEPQKWMLPGKGVAAVKVRAEVGWPENWVYGLWLDEKKQVIGLAHAVQLPPLPRGHFHFVGKRYNFYGVIDATRASFGKKTELLLFSKDAEKPLCRVRYNDYLK